MLVHPLGKLGRLADQPALVRPHSTPVTAFTLSSVQPTLLATGAADAVIKLWSLPADGAALKADLTECTRELRGCQGRVSALQFHPFASDVLASADFGLDGGAVRVWDCATGAAALRPVVGAACGGGAL